MPATLGHIGAQYLLSKAILPRADVKWVLAACLIPDVPWILQKVLLQATTFSPLVIRAYAIAQSSLSVSLLLCCTLACFARSFRVVFVTLALGSAAHLILDALQTKWGNGVLLFAPLDWWLWNAELFWPESLVTYGLFALGGLAATWIFFKERPTSSDLAALNVARLALASGLLAAYALVPLAQVSSVERANLHDVATLGSVEQRPGNAIALDRVRLLSREDAQAVRLFTGERIWLKSDTPLQEGVVSVKGRFAAPDTIVARDVHQHNGWGLREYASYLGLAFIALWWIVCFVRIGR